MAAACGSVWFANRELARNGRAGRAVELLHEVDYRAVAVGSLLPDLIDKPLNWFVLRGSDLGGHHIGHSIVFSLALLVVGLVASTRGDNRLFLLACGAITHVLFDSMTHVPWSLLYPVVKLEVPRSDFVLTATNIAGEAAAVIALFFALRRPGVWDRISAFVREGSIEG
jgi:membrane-bound metal-dependent hydrolase YbcI (DUF457 family)